MIRHRPDLVLEISAHGPNTVENDLKTAVEIAREHAMTERRQGILVTQRGYACYKWPHAEAAKAVWGHLLVNQSGRCPSGRIRQCPEFDPRYIRSPCR